MANIKPFKGYRYNAEKVSSIGNVVSPPYYKIHKEEKAELFDKSEFKSADNSEIMPIVEKVIENNPKAVEDYKGGKQKAIGSLIGMVMRETRGKADAKSVEAMLIEKLK